MPDAVPDCITIGVPLCNVIRACDRAKTFRCVCNPAVLIKACTNRKCMYVEKVIESYIKTYLSRNYYFVSMSEQWRTVLYDVTLSFEVNCFFKVYVMISPIGAHVCMPCILCGYVDPFRHGNRFCYSSLSSRSTSCIRMYIFLYALRVIVSQLWRHAHHESDLANWMSIWRETQAGKKWNNL